MSAPLREVRPGTRWIVAAYAQADEIVAAAKALRAAGITRWEAYTPFEVEELEDLALDRPSPIPLAMGIGGALSGAGAFFMLEFSTHVYPLDVGGRPLNSWPAFIPITFELTVLGASLTGLFALLIAAGLPRLHHPMFAAEAFDRASQDRFFLAVEVPDAGDQPETLRRLVHATHPLGTEELTS